MNAIGPTPDRPSHADTGQRKATRSPSVFQRGLSGAKAAYLRASLPLRRRPGASAYPRDTVQPDNLDALAGFERFEATVLAVSDGDTVRVRMNGESQRVRILGLDAPEIHTRKEAGGNESLQHLQTLLTPGEKVSVIADPSQDLYDEYDRALAYIINSRGVDVGRAQIAAGWAEVFRKASAMALADEYREAERQARAAALGLWAQH